MTAAVICHDHRKSLGQCMCVQAIMQQDECRLAWGMAAGQVKQRHLACAIVLHCPRQSCRSEHEDAAYAQCFAGDGLCMCSYPHAHKAEHEGLLPLKHSCAEWRQCYDALGPDSAPALVLDESCM